MALTAEQYKALREALVSAFPNDDHLAMMLQDEVSPPLSISSADTYPLRVFRLVNTAGGEGRLRELVIGASRAKPGNPDLKRFVQENLQSLLEVDSNSLSTDLLSSLIHCLNSITDFAEGILDACTQTLPDLDVNHPTLIKQLLNNDLSTDVKWLIVLELFLKTYGRNSENELYIIKFVQNLQCFAVGASKSALKTWLTDLPEELRPTQTVSKQLTSLSRPSNEALKNLQAYFLITVDYPEITTQTGKFGINGYLISRVGNDKELTKFQVITLQSPPDETSTQTIEEKQQKKGLFCTLQQIEHCLPDWLLQVQKVIANRCTELQNEFSLDLPPVSDLTIEFWLPFDHLAAAADTWTVYSEPVSKKQRNLVVGKEYRVVVRSYDRFISSKAFNELNRTWQNLNDFLQKPSDTASVKQRFEHVERWERLTAIQQQFMNQPFLGLTLTCPLCSEQYQTQRNELFGWILDAGIPMALWSRCSDLVEADHQKEMHKLLTADTLCQLDQLLEDQLLEQIKKTRKLANDKQPLGHHLAIWCDEPKRLIELKQFLEQGRLSA
jgi:hypothetical protein